MRFVKSEDALHCLPNLLEIMPETVHFILRIKETTFLDENVKKCLFDYLEAGKQRIKTLRLPVDDLTLKYIFNLKGMNIESFANDGNPSLSNELNSLELGSFTDRNKLVHLKLPYLRFSTYCRYFPNLETLAFRVDPANNRTKLKNLKNLKVKYNIQKLHIFFC